MEMRNLLANSDEVQRIVNLSVRDTFSHIEKYSKSKSSAKVYDVFASVTFQKAKTCLNTFQKYPQSRDFLSKKGCWPQNKGHVETLIMHNITLMFILTYTLSFYNF